MVSPVKSTVTGLKVLNDVQVNGSITVTGTSTHTGATTFAGAVTLSSTVATTGAATFASTIAVTGAATFGSTVSITGALTLTVPLTVANAGNAVKRLLIPVIVNAGGTLADNTTYKGYLPIGRVGKVTAVSVIAATAPAGGTNTVDVKKGGSAGQSVLSAAFNPTTLVADTISAASLNATPANLAFTATQGLYWEWVTGNPQTTDAINAALLIEVELTDF